MAVFERSFDHTFGTLKLCPSMLRLQGSLRAASRVASARLSPALAQAAASPIRVAVPAAWSRAFASHVPKAEITSRILSVVKNFQSVDANKVTPTAHFTNDLGLDSLDTVEIVMAFEDEFAIEIPDAEADKIQTVAAAIDYIAAHPQAK